MDFILKALTLATNGEGGIAGFAGGGYWGILVWVGILGLFYFILIRPQQKQQKAHRQLIADLEVGDHIVTIGGFKGKITKIKETSLVIRTAPDVELEIIKNAVGRKDPDFIKDDE